MNDWGADDRDAAEIGINPFSSLCIFPLKCEVDQEMIQKSHAIIDVAVVVVNVTVMKARRLVMTHVNGEGNDVERIVDERGIENDVGDRGR